MVPTQQPACGDPSVQTDWGQGVTHLLKGDLEKREVGGGEALGCT